MLLSRRVFSIFTILFFRSSFSCNTFSHFNFRALFSCFMDTRSLILLLCFSCPARKALTSSLTVRSSFLISLDSDFVSLLSNADSPSEHSSSLELSWLLCAESVSDFFGSGIFGWCSLLWREQWCFFFLGFLLLEGVMSFLFLFLLGVSLLSSLSLCMNVEISGWPISFLNLLASNPQFTSVLTVIVLEFVQTNRTFSLSLCLGCHHSCWST